jgi:sugar phosphate isomerase/epimerase
MQIRYAVSTMVFWERENPLSLERECEFLKALGFGVELWPTIRGQSECRYERRNWPRLAAAAKGMLVSLRSRTDTPTLQQWNEQIQCGKMLNANIVADLQSLRIPGRPQLENYDFAAEVVKLAEDNKVKLCLETGKLSTLKQVGEKFKSVCYCLDTGYANLDQEFTFKQYVDDLADRIAHLHLTDNYGQIDDHAPPGLRGGMPIEKWQYLLNALSKYNNDVVGSFEMSPAMPAVMICQASKFLFDELKWPNRPQKQPNCVNTTYSPI